MFVEKLHSEGLAHLSYLVGSGGEAAVVDPRRDCDVYLEMAREHGADIRYIVETHRNEDYLIGSCELAARCGAKIVHGAGLDFGYGEKVDDGDELVLGDVTLRVIATPGHTPESISLAVIDRATSEDPVAVFTGDCLFVGDVGRTDLLGEGKAREAAELLHRSIFERLLPLGDHVVIYPAHGAGSVCGSSMADREVSTLGYERRNNPALILKSKEEFIARKLEEQHYVPPYFRRMEELNRDGAPILGAERELPGLSVDRFVEAMESGAVAVDLRPAEAHVGAHVPGSVSLPTGLLPAYAGWVLPYDRDLLMIAEDEDQARHGVRLLRRLGYDRIAGALRGGLTAWATAGKRLGAFEALDGSELLATLEREKDDVVLLDVRKGQEEFERERLEGAKHLYLGHLPEKLSEVPDEGGVITFCGSGKRATVAASILARAGREGVRVALGSMAAVKALGAPTVGSDA